MTRDELILVSSITESIGISKDLKQLITAFRIALFVITDTYGSMCIRGMALHKLAAFGNNVKEIRHVIIMTL